MGATASGDGHGHILVIGGSDPVTLLGSAKVFSYDIATNVWTQLGDTPGGVVFSRVAALGADGLVYLIGGHNSAAVWVFDSTAGSWYAGPNLSIARGGPAVALGNDGFLYVMGGENLGQGNNGLATTEKLDTGASSTPILLSGSGGTVMVGKLFSYQAIAFGSPRPVFSLVTAPAGMTLNATTGLIAWTPAANQTGGNTVVVRASSTAGAAQQTFSINVIPIPTQTDFTAPTVPGSPTLTFRTATSVTMTWSAATDDVGETGYRIWGLFRGSRSSHISQVGTSTTRSFIAQSGATAFYISALDAAGNDSARSPGTGAGTLPRPSITHTNFAESATVIAGSSFLYTLAATAQPAPTFTTVSGPQGMTLTRTNGPTPGVDYAVIQWQPTPAQIGTHTFTVAATNPNTTGGSAAFTVTVLPNGTDTVPPTPVAQLTASAIAPDHATLTWTPAGDNIGVTNYHIVATHFGLPGQPNQVVTLDTSGANLTTPLAGLLPAAGYTTTITPSDAAGNTGPATQIFFTTLTQPFADFHMSAGAAPGTLAFDWTSFGSQWVFLLETSSDLSPGSWQPLNAPSGLTHLEITPNPAAPRAFYRMTATPAP